VLPLLYPPSFLLSNPVPLLALLSGVLLSPPLYGPMVMVQRMADSVLGAVVRFGAMHMPEPLIAQQPTGRERPRLVGITGARVQARDCAGHAQAS
jgi:hypothetical protein